MAVVIFIVGVLIGCAAMIIFYRRKHVGTLRIDTSDPTDGAYFFLEIDSGKMGSVLNCKSVLLSVNTKNYISQG